MDGGEALLLILCGLPFSGKSTLARAIAARLAIAHVELDRAHGERGSDLDTSAVGPADWLRAYRHAYRRLDAVLAAGQSAVFDATSYCRADRDRLRRIAAARGVRPVVVYLDLPVEVARARLARNRESGERWDVPDADFAGIAARFEPPAEDEGAVRFDGSMMIEDWIDRVLMPALKERER